jgi:hypothetical protein
MRLAFLVVIPFMLAAIGCSETGDSDPAPVEVPNPTLEGPFTGGSGAPFIQSTSFDLAEVGYRQTELFVSGTARAFTNLGPLGEDGFWEASLSGSTADYKVRIVIYRPIDVQAFNGTVIVEWLNVSGGVDAAPDWTSTHTELTREGYTWVGVSAQRVGIEGGGGAFNLSLKTIDPVRYGSLNHPGDSFSYDIFSQVAQAVIMPSGIDPLDGLRPERVIAVGESQSAFRLVTYINAVHPLVRLYDGFLVHSRGGNGAPLSQSPEPDIAAPAVVRTRTDLRAPVLTYQTETDLITLGYLPSRQPDSASFRLWEVAGTAHAATDPLLAGDTDQGDTTRGAELIVEDAPIPGFLECDTPINSRPQHFVLKAAVHALDRWVRGDGPPPSAPLLDVTGNGEFVLDQLGNVTGGIRTAAVDVPLATLSGLGQTGANFCRIFGTTVPFDDAMLANLYPTRAAYVSAVTAATDAAVEAGYIRPADAAIIKAAAEGAHLGS